MTTLTFLGAAGTVTGSKFLLEDADRRVLVDCGLYQGERQWRRLNWEDPGVAAGTLTDVVLTHTHLDHCGYLPALVHRGFTGPVWATAGTAALADIVLHDAAKLQEEDAANARAGGYSKHDPPVPLYTWADADRAMELTRVCEYGKPTRLAAQAVLTLIRAGHVLGSASAHVTLGAASVLFSGDLGRPRHPLLLPRDRPPAARTVVIESTYGDRLHPDEHDEHHVLGDAVRRTIGRGGSVLIPAFAVDRTELVLLALAHLREQDAIPDVPIYVDSPMALAALDVYQRPEHQAELRAESLDRASRPVTAAHCAYLRGVEATEHSRHPVHHRLGFRDGHRRASGAPPPLAASTSAEHRRSHRVSNRRHPWAPAPRGRTRAEDDGTVRSSTC